LNLPSYRLFRLWYFYENVKTFETFFTREDISIGDFFFGHLEVGQNGFERRTCHRDIGFPALTAPTRRRPHAYAFVTTTERSRRKRRGDGYAFALAAVRTCNVPVSRNGNATRSIRARARGRIEPHERGANAFNQSGQLTTMALAKAKRRVAEQIDTVRYLSATRVVPQETAKEEKKNQTNR
jgi:hypothetical protein